MGRDDDVYVSPMTSAYPPISLASPRMPDHEPYHFPASTYRIARPISQMPTAMPAPNSTVGRSRSGPTYQPQAR
jgi:hypothetical protein